MAEGRILKCLTLLDVYTRESLKIRVDYYMTSGDALREVESAFQEYGEPEYIRSDNGSEFLSKMIQSWLKEKQIATLYIPPGSPWENPYIESFHEKFRDECLSRELFLSLIEAHQIIEEWRKEYNQERPHSSLGYLPPPRNSGHVVATLRSLRSLRVVPPSKTWSILTFQLVQFLGASH